MHMLVRTMRNNQRKWILKPKWRTGPVYIYTFLLNSSDADDMHLDLNIQQNVLRIKSQSKVTATQEP